MEWARYGFHFSNWFGCVFGIAATCYGFLILNQTSDMDLKLNPKDMFFPAFYALTGIFVGLMIAFATSTASYADFEGRLTKMSVAIVCGSLFGLFSILMLIFVLTTESANQNSKLQYWESAWMNKTNSTIAVDSVQETLRCCGNSTYLDYDTEMLPKSCCLAEIQNCTKMTAFEVGCAEKLLDMVSHYTEIFAVVYAGMGLSMIGSMGFGGYMGSVFCGTREHSGYQPLP